MIETPRLLAFDIDGTLIRTSGEVSQPVRAALERAQAAGMVVGVATGRPWPQAHEVIEDAGGMDFAVCLNGAVIIEGDTGDPIAIRAMSGELAVEAARRARAVLPDVTLASDMADGRHFWELDFAPDMPMDLAAQRVSDAVAAVDGDVLTWLVAVEGMGPDEIVDQLHHQMPLGTEVRPSGLDMAEIAAFGVSKASGLQIVADRHGVRRDQVMAFGDGMNDLEMMRWAGTPVAMDNGVELVKDLSRVIAPSNDDDGVATIIDKVLDGVPLR